MLILCVEDNYDDFELIEFQLAKYKTTGLLLEHCDCQAAAVTRILQGGIDIVLLDLSLPDSQGIDTFKKMRSTAPGIPIIVLSGTTDLKVALETLKYGAEDCLTKDSSDITSLFRSISYAQARHDAREALNRLATIVEASDDAIIGKTLNGTITSWNRGASRLFGYTPEEATGKSISMLLPPESQSELDGIMTAIANGETIVNLETVRINKKGERLDISVTVSPIRGEDGIISGAAAIDRDITERKKTQRILEESEERYRLLVAGVKDYAIFMLNPEGLVESWNEGAQRLKGYDVSEILGKSFSVFYTHDDQKLGLPGLHLKTAIAKGSSEEQGWRVRKDGSSFFADIVITALFKANGKLRGFTKITRDITEREAAEQEISDTRLRLSLALEAALVGVWDFDLLKKNSVWRSPRHDEIYGHPEPLPEWNLERFMTYVLPEDRELVTESIAKALDKGKLFLQCRIIRANDQALRWIAVRGDTLCDEEGKPIRLLGTIIDITDFQDQQEQQRMLAIMKEREDFMATLTHDMKNPLIGANRLLEMFVAGNLGELTDKQNELLNCLMDSNSGLLKLIADLIDVYRMEKDVNNLLMADCDLTKTLNACVGLILPFAKLRSVNVTTQLPEQLIAAVDNSRIERLMQNLLDNALKFAPDGGTVQVRLLSVGDTIVLEVEDNGAGIAREEQPELFKRFSQGAAGKRYTGGSGLGLYLCKQVAEAHGGVIECESQPNKATIFRVILPNGNTRIRPETLASCQ